MVTYSNVFDNGNANVIAQMGSFQVIEHEKDLSVSSYNALSEYFASKMNIRRRQVLATLENSGVVLQAGAMQWMSGNVQMNSGVSGVGNFLGNVAKAAVTKESVAKPIYFGTGSVMLEPTYNYILLLNVAEWGQIVLQDGMFLACDSVLQRQVVARNNVSSAVFGGEGLFNLALSGNGILVCESPVPREELIEVILQDDEMRIDGNMAVAWSGSLQFTVEKSTKSLLGSAISGEGLVNVYRGSGRILLAPTIKESVHTEPSDSNSDKGPSQAPTQAGGGAAQIGGALKTLGNVMDFFS